MATGTILQLISVRSRLFSGQAWVGNGRYGADNGSSGFRLAQRIAALRQPTPSRTLASLSSLTTSRLTR